MHLNPARGEVAEARAKAGFVSVEQPEVVRATAPETASVAAGGPGYWAGMEYRRTARRGGGNFGGGWNYGA